MKRAAACRPPQQLPVEDSGMWQYLCMCWYRLRPARSVEDALRQVVRPGVLARAQSRCAHPGLLLETLAEQERFDRAELLSEVGRLLGLPVCAELHMPSSELAASSGAALPQLVEHRVLPQHAKDGSGRVLFASADLRSSLLRGLGPIALAHCSDIERMWRDFLALHAAAGRAVFSLPQCVLILRQLVREAIDLGAAEVLLGQPDSASYELIAGGVRYKGTIHRAACEYLKTAVRAEGGRTFFADEQFRWDISAAPCGGAEGVIYVSWKPRNQPPVELKEAAGDASLEVRGGQPCS